MASYDIAADGGSYVVTGSDVLFPREIFMAAEETTLFITGSPVSLTLADTDIRVRWALVALELEVQTKGGMIRLQQGAKK